MFLDESGVTTEMTRRYGWAPRSERVSEAVPAGHWRALTVLAALTTAGVLASMTIESPTEDRKSTRLNSSHSGESRMPSSA